MILQMDTSYRFWRLCALALAVADGICLFPVAFGMLGVADPLFPFASAIVFLLVLGGPVMLFGFGFSGFVRSAIRPVIVALGLFLIAVGSLLFWRAPSLSLLLNWAAMAVAIVGIAAALRSPSLWAEIGGAWTSALLGILSAQSLWTFFHPSSSMQFPKWVVAWIPECLLTGVFAFGWWARCRSAPGPP